ncbi:MAG TPA: EamA family transporter [Acidobacteriaceae bacterium]|nr:EamA family transporter [Acidobacteriaceae bacterium]
MLTWLLILVTVVAGSCGDVLCAKGMSTEGELHDFHPSAIRRVIRSIIARRLVIFGALCDAVSFFALLGLLSVTKLSIAVPATALSFVVDTLGAEFILHEGVHWKRWMGVLLVTAGVLLTVHSGVHHKPDLSGTRASTVAAVQPDQY